MCVVHSILDMRGEGRASVAKFRRINFFFQPGKGIFYDYPHRIT